MTSKEWLKIHGRYERKALKIILSHVKKQLLKIPLTDINENNAELTIAVNIDKGFAYNMLRDVYLDIGLKHGNYIGKQINKFEVKRYEKPLFSEKFMQLVNDYLLTQGLIKVTTIEATFIDKVKALIVNQLAEGKTIQQISRMMASPKLYKWQAMRIARTETTFATSFASEKASEMGNIELQKEWIAADDDRTRNSHNRIDGAKVDKDGLFSVGGYKMKYPGDPNAPASQVINCRCTVAYVPKLNPDGTLIPKTY